MTPDTASDLKQIIFKLQTELSFAKWENAEKDIKFLGQMKQEFEVAWDVNDSARFQLGLKMIDDWIHELKTKNP